MLENPHEAANDFNGNFRKVQLSRRMGGIGSEQLLFGQHVASFRKYIFGQTHLSLYLGTCESDLRVLAIAFFGAPVTVTNKPLML